MVVFPQDMTFKLVEKEDATIGEPIAVTMKVSNSSNTERVVKATLTAQVVYYTGVVAGNIKKESYSIKCTPHACMYTE